MTETKAAPKTATAHKPKPKDSAKLTKQQNEVLAEFMSTGIDFSPFTIDVGDGVEWAFTPDPMPSETARLSDGMKGLEAAAKGDGDMDAVFEGLVSAIRDRLMDDKQKAEFPKPMYGTNAIMFFALHLASGRSGFPTEQD